MEAGLNEQCPEVRLRAYRAIDEPETNALFIQGHTEVLTSIGVKKVTSSKNGWASNPAVFGIVVESLYGNKINCGAREQVAGVTQPLPNEDATGAMDASIHRLVWEYGHFGTGEICGLWNSHQLAGYGIGSPLLIRGLIAISSQIGLKTLFALCAPYTVKPVVNCGMVLVESIGNKGTFYYPKLDLIATAMVLNDVQALSKAMEEDRLAIIQMRDNPDKLKICELKNKKINIDFDLRIPKLEQWDLAQTIASIKEKPFENLTGEEEPTFF